MPLIQAALDGNASEIRRLIALKPRLASIACSKSPGGKSFVFPVTPAHLAASRNGSPETFAAILRSMAFPTWSSVYDEGSWLLTPAVPLDGGRQATDDDQRRKMESLVDRYPEVVRFCGPSQSPLLSRAVGQDLAPIAELLVRRGADVELPCAYGLPLHFASTPRMVRLLIDAGADPNGVRVRDGQTPVYQERNPDVVRALVERGARLDVVDQEGRTPLIFACEYAEDADVRELLALGAQSDAISPSTGLSALDCVIRRRSEFANFPSDGRGAARMVEILVKAGASVNGRNRRGDTPLLSWVREFVHQGTPLRLSNEMRQRYEWSALRPAIRQAFSLGADLSAKDRRGKTARDLLREAGFEKEAQTIP